MDKRISPARARAYIHAHTDLLQEAKGKNDWTSNRLKKRRESEVDRGMW